MRRPHHHCPTTARAVGPVSLGLALASLFVTLTFSSGCAEDVLMLKVRAQSRVDTYDLTVMRTRDRRILLEVTGEPVDSENPTRDISQEGEELRLAIRFNKPATYLVHFVGRSAGPLQVYTYPIRVDGPVTKSIELLLLAGMDADGDGFISQAACDQLGNPNPYIDCAYADCNDNDPTWNPLAIDICGDGLDQDCSGEDAPCVDADGDGETSDTDCDDNDPNRFHGNPEEPDNCQGQGIDTCGDGIDQDCDGQDTACNHDNDCDGSPNTQDCAPDDPTIFPGQLEDCTNDRDDNCDGQADEGCITCDLDGDGWQRVDPPNGCPDATYVAEGRAEDCDDFDSGVFPGITDNCGGDEGGHPACAAYRLCDGIDNDCDGIVDEGCPDSNCDQDNDGFLNTTPGCNPPAGAEDCDDASHLVYPGAPDICGDGELQNCNTDSTCGVDADGDGYDSTVDCDDNNAQIYPGKVPEICNGVDDDCDGLVDEGNPDATGSMMLDIYCNDDNDGICGDAGGAGRCVCTKIVPNTAREPGNRVMCPDEDLGAEASPRCVFAPQPEIERCDHTDHDCNGVTDDPNGDNLEELGDACGTDEGECMPGTVIGCDHANGEPDAFNPSFVCSADYVGPITEQCNGLDDDCDGGLPLNEQDGDNDGYMACSGCGGGPFGPGVWGCDDCADGNPAMNPGMPDNCNTYDDDCNPGTGNGSDECGGSTPTCCGSIGQCVNTTNNTAHCSGCYQACNADLTNLCTNSQCRCGTNPPCNPGQECDDNGTSATCVCNSNSCPNGCCQGNNCIVYTSQSPGVCGTNGNTCAPCPFNRTCSNGRCYCFGDLSPPPENACSGGVDDDCDGQIDCNDSDCNGDPCGPDGLECISNTCQCSGNGGPVESTEVTCSGGHDNDCDGDTDCADSDCNNASCGANGRICISNTCQCSGNGGTAQGSESICNDGYDNDCDGNIDCDDGQCDGEICGVNGLRCNGTTCECPGGTTENNCSNGVDDDCDGQTDCADGNCDGDPCQPNGHICQGNSCVCSGNGGTVQGSESICDDGHDNDCDGNADCDDPGCLNDPCQPNGYICNASNQCVCSGNGGTPQGTESNCGDGFDNDCDGDADCADSNCTGQTCDPFGYECNPGGNCVCTGNGGTAEGSESICNDGYDNDCDGTIDCFDPGCAGQTCGATTLTCTGIGTCG